MDHSIIEQIRTHASLRHLISGWPKITVTEKDREAIARAEVRLLAITTRERWASVSGVSTMDVAAWAEFLFAHGIITAEGVDPTAKMIVDRLGLGGLPKDLRDQLLPKPE